MIFSIYLTALNWGHRASGCRKLNEWEIAIKKNVTVMGYIKLIEKPINSLTIVGIHFENWTSHLQNKF
jgi:hypothetical protein